MARSFRRSAELTLRLPQPEALSLFTPEGERRWAGGHGWDPTYPDVSRTNGPGTVFITTHAGRMTWWVIVDSDADRMRYARVTPAGLAGTVEVSVVATAPESTTVRVTYDMTATLETAAGELQAFQARYDQEIASWATAIDRIVTPSGSPGQFTPSDEPGDGHPPHA